MRESMPNLGSGRACAIAEIPTVIKRGYAFWFGPGRKPGGLADGGVLRNLRLYLRRGGGNRAVNNFEHAHRAWGEGQRNRRGGLLDRRFVTKDIGDLNSSSRLQTEIRELQLMLALFLGPVEHGHD